MQITVDVTWSAPLSFFSAPKLVTKKHVALISKRAAASFTI